MGIGFIGNSESYTNEINTEIRARVLEVYKPGRAVSRLCNNNGSLFTGWKRFLCLSGVVDIFPVEE